MPFIVANPSALIATDVNGPVVLVNVKSLGPKGTGVKVRLPGTAKVSVFDATPSFPVPVTVTLGLPLVTKFDEPLTAKLTSVNVESGPAFSVSNPTVKSAGTGTKVPTVPVWSVAA
jgi:hypothetical protein